VSSDAGAAQPAELGEELGRIVREATAQKAEARGIVEALSEPQYRWRSAPQRWSVGEHLAHLPVASWQYLIPMRATMKAAREQGVLGREPFRYGWLGGRFVRSMEPPPRFRVRTFRTLLPASDVARERALADFDGAQDAIVAAAMEADGLDLARVRMRSPFVKWMKLSLGHAFGVLLAHNRRHFWLMREVIANPAFPTE
jgi:hypothetical protein